MACSGSLLNVADQLRIHKLRAQGFTIRGIARIVEVSPRTVQKYIRPPYVGEHSNIDRDGWSDGCKTG